MKEFCAFCKPNADLRPEEVSSGGEADEDAEGVAKNFRRRSIWWSERGQSEDIYELKGLVNQVFKAVQ